MADRACNYCEDKGDCTRCSRFFQPDALHSKCRRRWREHLYNAQPDYNQGVYPGWYSCPAPLVEETP